jgi:hypothetical protein
MKKMKTEDILKKLKELRYYEIEYFIHSLDLTNEQFEILAEDENGGVRMVIAQHPDLPKGLMYKFAEDGNDLIVREVIAQHPYLPEDLIYKIAEDENKWIRRSIAVRADLPKNKDLIIILSCDSEELTYGKAIKKLKKINNLKSEDLENAYALIRTSKYIGREEFEKTFNYIISNFPKLTELANFFKSIILKGKGDLK